MSEWEDKLNAILSSPETMEQIMSLASSLSGGGENGGEGTASVPSEQQQTSQMPQMQQMGAPQTADPLGGLGSLLSGFDPSMLQKVIPLMQEFTAGSDEKQALLTALKPFLKQESQEKVDKAIRIARLSKVIRSAMKLFREDGYV